jgi:hypothetical protein
MDVRDDYVNYDLTRLNFTAFQEDGFHDDPQKYTSDELFFLLRVFRNSLLNLSDWTQLPDALCDKEAWAEYRQELRNITDGLDNPLDVVFPARPKG